MLNPKVCNYPLHFADRAGTPLLLHLWNLMSLGQVARAFLAGWNKVLMWNLVFWSCSWSEKRSLKKPRATFRVFYIWYIIEYSNATYASCLTTDLFRPPVLDEAFANLHEGVDGLFPVKFGKRVAHTHGRRWIFPILAFSMDKKGNHWLYRNETSFACFHKGT